MAIVLGPDGLQVAYSNHSGEVVFCRAYEGQVDREQLLDSLVDEYGWQQMPCTVVLHPAYYQLVQAEAPAVPEQEMATAVRWKVKDLLDVPLHDAAVEYFSLPEDAYRGQRKMLYVAAVRTKTLQSLAGLVQRAGFAVDSVEITELAVHNLITRVPLAAGGVAMMSLMEVEGLINLVEDGAIYLCRRLDIGCAALAGDTLARSREALVLEIQRSLDFYESQLGKGVITQLLYAPAVAELQPMAEFLDTQLGLNILPLPVPEQVSADLDGEEVARCYAAIGAALGEASTSPTGVASAAH